MCTQYRRSVHFCIPRPFLGEMTYHGDSRLSWVTIAGSNVGLFRFEFRIFFCLTQVWQNADSEAEEAERLALLGPNDASNFLAVRPSVSVDRLKSDRSAPSDGGAHGSSLPPHAFVVTELKYLMSEHYALLTYDLSRANQSRRTPSWSFYLITIRAVNET